MAGFSDHWLAGVLLVAYTAVLLYHARVGARRSHNMTEYYVGGRSLGGVVVGISFFATFASTNSYIGHAGKGYEYGLPWMTMAVLIVVFTWLSWTMVAPRLRRFTSHWDALTLPDYLEARFGAHNRALRLAAALVILLSSHTTPWIHVLWITHSTCDFLLFILSLWIQSLALFKE